MHRALGEDVLIARNERFGLRMDCARNDRAIGGVKFLDSKGLAGWDKIGHIAQVGDDLRYLLTREAKLARERAFHLSGDEFGNNDFMLRHERLEQVRTQPARGERGDQDVGVQCDPHERARNTSSSVR